MSFWFSSATMWAKPPLADTSSSASGGRGLSITAAEPSRVRPSRAGSGRVGPGQPLPTKPFQGGMAIVTLPEARAMQARRTTGVLPSVVSM